jgi:hypothetical protein
MNLRNGRRVGEAVGGVGEERSLWLKEEEEQAIFVQSRLLVFVRRAVSISLTLP